MSGANSAVQERYTEAPPPAWGKQNRRIVLLCPALGVTPLIQLVVASKSVEDIPITPEQFNTRYPSSHFRTSPHKGTRGRAVGTPCAAHSLTRRCVLPCFSGG